MMEIEENLGSVPLPCPPNEIGNSPRMSMIQDT